MTPFATHRPGHFRSMIGHGADLVKRAIAEPGDQAFDHVETVKIDVT